MSTELDLDGVVVRSTAVSEMENNVYLLTARATGQKVLIDAADDIDAIARLLEDSSADGPEADGLHAVITTHRHWDHHRALRAVLGELGGPAGVVSIAGADDAESIEEQTGADVDVRAEHGDVLEFDGFSLEVTALRGHTPGSIALLLRDSRDLLFSGDSLFPGGPGKTDGPAEFTSLMDDLEERVFGVLPDETLVLPGHGASTTLGDERPKLGEWRARGW